MPFINVSVPAVGDPTDQQLISDMIGNDQFLYNQFLAVVGNRETVLNGSFETDADSDGEPDGWVFTAYTGGTFLWDNSTVAADGKAYHGKRSVKYTSPGGASNGGGNFVSESFIEVSEGRPFKIQWAQKSSVADVHNKVEVIWYDSTQTLISTTTVHDDAATNPTGWTLYDYAIIPPANSRYCKLKFYACVDDDTTAGSTWYDDIRIFTYIPAFERRVMFNSAGSFKFKVPTGASWCAVICVGGGGGGGTTAGGANGAGGGGGGGMAWDIQQLTAGTSYAFTVGAGGGSGASGSASSFTGTATLTANGGANGATGAGGGTGGAGGTATGGRTNTTGATGDTRSGAVGGDGGEQPAFGGRGVGGTSGNNGGAAPGYGGGGGGAGGAGAGQAGGAGANGIVLILF